MMHHYVNVGSSFDNYSFASEKDVLEAGSTVYIYEEIQDPQGNICVEHIHQVTMVKCISTIEVEETYKSRIEG